MAIKTILVPLSSGEISRSALEAAFVVARRFDAHMEVLHVRPDPRNMIPYVGEGMSGALIEEVMLAADREAGDRAASARAMVRDDVDRHGIPAASAPAAPGVSAWWREDAGREDEAVAKYGRLADLVVVSRPLREAEVPTSTIFEAALFECGQPLLVAPPRPVGDFGHDIMIAWNGSPEAARAVSAAIPFLGMANRIRVLSVAGWGEGLFSLQGIADRLAWHGVQAEVKAVTEFAGTIGETVLSEAEAFGADLIVMGAYTQSRLQQMILGGVTRHVLSTASVPLVMAH